MPRAARALDVALAAAIAAGGTAEAWLGPSDEPVVLTAGLLVMCAALVRRRTRPLPSALVVVAAFAVTHAATGQLTDLAAGTLPLVVATYTAAASLPRGRALAVGAAAFVAAQVSALVDSGTPSLSSSAYAALVVGVSFAAGRAVHARHEHVVVLQQRAALLEAEQQARADAAVAAERSRLARELHDVVAHGVSLMVVQAGAAEGVLRSDPDAAGAALREVQAAGRQALAELRRMLDLLRSPDVPGDGAGDDGLGPQPGLADLPALAAAVEQAGVPVSLRVADVPAQLPPGVSLSAYRIVQEALTNTVKHAGRATARVEVGCHDGALHVEVADTGQGAAAPPDGLGHGLAGMRERVALFGGELEVRAGDGFRVRATLPVDG